MTSLGVRGQVDDYIREIEFSRALSELQGFLGHRVMVTVGIPIGSGASFVSVLERVESLGEEAAMLHLADGAAVHLDPGLRPFLGSGRPGQVRWLEFWAPGQVPRMTIEVILLAEEG